MLSRRANQVFSGVYRSRRCVQRSISGAFLPGKRFHSILRQLLIGLAALLIPLAPICLAESSTEGNPHHFLQTCGNCHELNAKTDNSRDKTIGPLHRDINQSCSQAGCHDYNSVLSHPVGIRARGHIPSEMPLNSKGQITCLTCHDETNRNNPNYFPAFLRRASGRDLCASCHQASGNTPRKRAHWQFTTKAHLDAGNGRFSTKDYGELTGGMDPESYTCLGCHDNISAVILGENESTAEKMRRRSDMSDHPIGMAYARMASRNHREFNMPLTMDARIRFFNGRVGCGSCHNLYNGQKNNLAVPSVRGNLCRQCHIR